MNRPTLKYMFCVLSILVIGTIQGQIVLPRLISDGMVLQRNQPLKVWGWAKPGEIIKVIFHKQAYTATTGNNKKWSVLIPPQKPGGPFEMQISGSNEIKLKNILIGDVWICGGQSNMELTMDRVKEKYADEVQQANYPLIRQFTVPDKFDFNTAADDVPAGEWKEATTRNIREFSAVAYFFAKELFTEYKVPIGLINSALGGSPAEAWISEESLTAYPRQYNEAMRFRNKALIDSIESHDRNVSSNWYRELNSKDKGQQENWRSTDLNDNAWDSMQVPGYWSSQQTKNVNGAVWFRKKITLPNDFAIDHASIEMGRIVDADSVFINGRFIGTTTYQYPPRRYVIPSRTLRVGENLIVVRVISNAGRGGFVLDKNYVIRSGAQKIDLKGIWKYRIGATMESLPGQTAVRWKPLGLYNAMIAPIIKLPIKGVIWYQGEANTRDPAEYKNLMETLVSDWRKKWNQGDFPFLFVQLANFMEAKANPVESNWAATRESQRENLKIVNTGMAVAIDVGDWNDIHPENKKDIGHRLSLQAKRTAYGNKKLVYQGPMVESAKVVNNQIIVSFSSIGGGLIAQQPGSLQQFQIAGEDRKFAWANAVIIGKTVKVWNEKILAPRYVRYAWADNPEGANLYNKEGLPASPFEIKAK